MGGILLDTTVLIDLLRGRTGAASRLSQLAGASDEPYVCAINVEEVMRGILSGEHDHAATLFAGLLIVPLGYAEGSRAGEWRREHAALGQTLSEADCLIAAAAFTVGGRLATGNPRDFPMEGITVEHWPVGEIVTGGPPRAQA